MPYKDKQDKDNYNKAYYLTHKLEIATQHKNWYQAHKTEQNERSKRWAIAHKDTTKVEVLTYYGNGKLACVKCGYDTDLRALSIDHINGGGNKHRQEVGTYIYLWLKANNLPPGYQTLCMNCQFVKKIQRCEDRSWIVRTLTRESKPKKPS